VELGIHLCDGDFGHQHTMRPRDTRALVTVAEGILERLSRPLNWLHLPVPRDLDETDHFAPLADVHLSPTTRLYLGLLHLADGVDGADRRMAAARRFVADFGVATECGWGRRDPATSRTCRASTLRWPSPMPEADAMLARPAARSFAVQPPVGAAY
jgi:hypothetical protein